MTKAEALEIMKTAPRGSRPSKVNPALTEEQSYSIVWKWLDKQPEDALISGIMEKRIYQIAKNQRNPRY